MPPMKPWQMAARSRWRSEAAAILLNRCVRVKMSGTEVAPEGGARSPDLEFGKSQLEIKTRSSKFELWHSREHELARANYVDRSFCRSSGQRILPVDDD